MTNPFARYAQKSAEPSPAPELSVPEATTETAQTSTTSPTPDVGQLEQDSPTARLHRFQLAIREASEREGIALQIHLVPGEPNFHAGVLNTPILAQFAYVPTR